MCGIGGPENVFSPLTAELFGFEPPTLPKTPDPQDPDEERRKARAAADRRRKQLAGAFGSEDTSVAGNIGPTPSGLKGGKQLIGA